MRIHPSSGGICDICLGELRNNHYYDVWEGEDETLYVMWTSGPPLMVHKLSPQHPMYKLLEPFKGSHLCKHCVTQCEVAYIWRIPLEDLPLHINGLWITPRGTRTYQERLQTLEPSI